MAKCIVSLVRMDKIPENCLDCLNEWCVLPLASRRREPTIRKPYRTKRHKDCPLRLVEESALEGVK